MSATDFPLDVLVRDSGAVSVYLNPGSSRSLSFVVAEGRCVGSAPSPECALVKLTPAEAREIAANLVAGADFLDPQGDGRACLADPVAEAARLGRDSGGAL